jgi:hypothetical protein
MRRLSCPVYGPCQLRVVREVSRQKATARRGEALGRAAIPRSQSIGRGEIISGKRCCHVAGLRPLDAAAASP